MKEKKLWFKRKLYGWGWYPCSWEGWLVTVIYAVLIVAFVLTVDESAPTREVWFTFLFPAILLTIVFFRISYRRGEKPGWQWGKKKED